MKILLVDDHAVVRAGLRRLLGTLPLVEILEAATGREALTMIRAEEPALVMLDLNLPGLGGFELLQRIKAEKPDLRVLVLSMHAEMLYATRALRAGAAGYLSKNVAPEELLDAVRRVMDGGRYIEAEMAQALALQTTDDTGLVDRLTERDLEILRLLGDGRSLSDIADALGVSYKTIANTCRLIKAKLGVTRTADLIRLSLDLAGSDPPQRVS
jgi:DNA-binding NarL/FixJ family response regulator